MTTNEPVIWRANPGPQTEVLRRNEFEIGFGGARGGGKSDAGRSWIAEPKYVSHPKYRALVIRKNSKDLVDWIDKAMQLYSRIRGLRAVQKGTDIHFGSGAVIRTGHLKDDNAYGKYQGHEYQKELVEELTQIPTEDNYLKLLSSCRSTIPELKPQVFSTFNPDGPGFFWVKKRFCLDGIPNEPIVTIDSKTGLKRVFVPSKLQDNPYLNTDAQYRSFLNGLPDGLREAWRDGSWNDPVISGAYYTAEILQARSEKRIKPLAYDPRLKVHTIWDLGIDDSMSILFVQRTSTETRIINSYYNSDQGLNHYQSKLQQLQQQNNYVYGKHYAPHDANKRELSSGKTIIQTAKSMGLDFETIPMVGITDGIQKVRLMWPRLYIDEIKCEQALNAFINYHREWNESLLKYDDKAIHDWSSHFADCLRYLSVVEEKLINTDLEKKVQAAWDYDQPTHEAPSWDWNKKQPKTRIVGRGIDPDNPFPHVTG